MINDPVEIILEHLRAIRTTQEAQGRKTDTLQSDVFEYLKRYQLFARRITAL
jgi:hypothetical protein